MGGAGSRDEGRWERRAWRRVRPPLGIPGSRRGACPPDPRPSLLPVGPVW